MKYIISLLLFCSVCQAATPDEDFASRCSAPGVVACYPLDTEQQLQQQEIATASDGTRQGYIDNILKVSGTGSLRFRLRAGVRSSNIGGAWSASLGKNFGVNETLYIQYRFMASANLLLNNKNYYHSSFKLSNIHGTTSTCQNSEFTATLYNRGYGQSIESYTNCGDGFSTSRSSTQVIPCNSAPGGDCLLMQGSSFSDGPNVGYNCRYQSQTVGDGNGDGCARIDPWVWYTVYQVISLGTLNGSNTGYQAFIAREGGPYLQFHRVTGINWGSQDNHVARVRLETYMTELSRPGGSAAPVDAYIWYDELIISTQSIAAPTGVPPRAPTGVSAP